MPFKTGDDPVIGKMVCHSVPDGKRDGFKNALKSDVGLFSIMLFLLLF